MHVILFGLGLMLTAAGFAVTGYGIREIEFSIGSTLILAGTVAGTGGLLLIGMAAAVRQLRLIAAAAAPRQVSRVAPQEPAEPQLPGSTPRNGPVLARIPFPPRPQAAEPKPRLGTAVAEPFTGDMVGPAPSVEVEPRAPRVAAPSRPVEPPMVEDADEVPLSPRPPLKAPLRHAPAADPATRGRAEPRTTNGSTASASADEPRAETAGPAATERGEQSVNFDALWPAEKRPGRLPREAARSAPAAPFVERRGEAARREIARNEAVPRRSEAAPVRAESSRAGSLRAEPAVLRAEPAPLRTEPAPLRMEADPVRAEPYSPGAEPPALRVEPPPLRTEPELSAAEPAPTTPPEPPRAVSILKSGVVDGMAYTLYADGSIEAQLPAGTVRFGSIAELREHIEKNS